MSDCCPATSHFGRARSKFGASEVTYAEMVTRGALRAVTWLADTHREWIEYRRAVMALDSLEKMDDRRLADIGISRDDLTVAALSLAAAKRNRTRAGMGYQA